MFLSYKEMTDAELIAEDTRLSRELSSWVLQGVDPETTTLQHPSEMFYDQRELQEEMVNRGLRRVEVEPSTGLVSIY